jgi:hypothetical protein
MLWWFVAVVCALALTVLVGAVLSVRGRLRLLRRAQRRLRVRSWQAQRLQAKLAAVQARGEALRQALGPAGEDSQ